jgi:hypothetical protein
VTTSPSSPQGPDKTETGSPIPVARATAGAEPEELPDPLPKAEHAGRPSPVGEIGFQGLRPAVAVAGYGPELHASVGRRSEETGCTSHFSAPHLEDGDDSLAKPSIAREASACERRRPSTGEFASRPPEGVLQREGPGSAAGTRGLCGTGSSRDDFAKLASGGDRWHHTGGAMPTRDPSGAGMLRLSAAILLIGGPILALVLRSWGVGGLVFGLGAILLGVRQIRLAGDRGERFIGVALLLGGAFTAIEGSVRLLSGAAP